MSNRRNAVTNVPQMSMQDVVRIWLYVHYYKHYTWLHEYRWRFGVEVVRSVDQSIAVCQAG